jgi:apolipoprotein N-acyltransferase
MERLARAIAARRGLRRYGLAVLLGVLAAGGLAPLNVVVLLVVAFTGLVWLLDGATDRRTAFAIGWAFGFGFFVAGLHWIVYPLLVDAGRFAWMIPFALTLLPGGLALFVGLATWAAHSLGWRGALRILALAVAWTAAEWLRGHVLTGFPWHLIGYAWMDVGPVLRAGAYLGVYGLSFVTVFAAAALAGFAPGPGAARGSPWPAGAAVVAICAAALLGGFAGTDPVRTTESIRLRIVQPNIPQALKWDRGERERNLFRHIELSRAPGHETRDVVIWPETASTFPIDSGSAVAEVAARALTGPAHLIAGAPRVTGTGDDFRAYNGLVVLDADTQVVASYDKHHLVPFGEYLPLRKLLGRLGVEKLVQGSPVDFSPGTGPRTLRVPGLPGFSPLICYEAIFPGAVAAADQRPAWLLSLTNDAWFGPNAGPAQHFAMARMRAVEEGLPIVRAANTGISAVVDAGGRVQDRLDTGVKGVIDADLPPPHGRTFYSRFGDLVVFTLLAFGIVLIGLRRRFVSEARP